MLGNSFRCRYYKRFGPPSRKKRAVLRVSELMQGVGELARLQGLHCAPEGGAVWMAARQLLASGWINPSETVVLFNTGAAVKYNHLLRCEHALRLNCNDPRALDNLETAL